MLIVEDQQTLSCIETIHTEHIEIGSINSTPVQKVISIGSTPEQPIHPAIVNKTGNYYNIESNFLQAVTLSFRRLGQQRPQKQPQEQSTKVFKTKSPKNFINCLIYL